jgi:hypothetical protein
LVPAPTTASGRSARAPPNLPFDRRKWAASRGIGSALLRAISLKG